MSIFTLARRMGTSVQMIDRTYGHLALDAEEHDRALLDKFDARPEGVCGHVVGTADGDDDPDGGVKTVRFGGASWSGASRDRTDDLLLANSPGG